MATDDCIQTVHSSSRFSRILDLLASFHSLGEHNKLLTLYQTCCVDMFERLFQSASAIDLPHAFEALRIAFTSPSIALVRSALKCFGKVVDSTRSSFLLKVLSNRMNIAVSWLVELMTDGRFDPAAHPGLTCQVFDCMTRVVALDRVYPDLKLCHITTMLNSVSALTVSSADSSISVGQYLAAYRFLHALITRRRKSISSIIPTTLFMVDFLLTVLAENRIRLSPEDGLSSLTSSALTSLPEARELCARNLSRLYQAIGFHRSQLQFGKFALPLIATYIQVLQRCPLAPAIKETLDEGITSLLDISSRSSFVELNASLSVTGKAIFKQLYASYQKNRYSGKV